MAGGPIFQLREEGEGGKIKGWKKEEKKGKEKEKWNEKERKWMKNKEVEREGVKGV